ncbi:MAG: hypothetical protein NTW52_03770 [Planctomycetota bacterium]|nr:hypothetical protein [Planctomycetota bacterium]
MKSVLEDLARSHGMAFWIDRRVDGDQSISLSTDASATVQSTLEKLAADCNCEIAYLNQIVYFAPRTQAATADFAYWNLAIATQTASSMKADRSRESADLWQWSNPSEPTRLIRDRSQRQFFAIENMDLIEHDLWAPYSLPPGSFAAQWSCVLAGFGATLLQSNQAQQQEQWSIIASPPPEDVSFDYSPKQMISIGKAEFTKWKEMWPSSTVKKTQLGLWKIDASVAAHREFIRRTNATEIERFAARATKPKSKQSIENSRFSLKLQGTLSAVFTALREQAGIEVTPWPLPANIAERRITLDLKEVTLDSLLQSLGQQAKLEIIRQDKIVTIRIP